MLGANGPVVGADVALPVPAIANGGIPRGSLPFRDGLEFSLAVTRAPIGAAKSSRLSQTVHRG